MEPIYKEICEIKKVVSYAKANKNIELEFIYKEKRFSIINRNDMVFDISYKNYPSYTICIPIANTNPNSSRKLVKGIQVILVKLINYMVYSNIILEADIFSEGKNWKRR